MSNRLIHESSPYLQQHAHNPVDWYAWGEEAFERARREQKPVLVSIGYAACHWCHVMERESFEDEAIAAYMNEHFINIKVDIEARPDVDHLYMDALQVLNGQGGWPLNMFVTPDRKPFYGGTYFPPARVYQRASWMEVLEAINLTWQKKPEDIHHQSEQLVAHLQQLSLTETATGAEDTAPKQQFDTMFRNIMGQADTESGGFGAAPKFPQTMTIQFLLDHYFFTGEQLSLDQALLSLDALLNGGIYDQLGGGLARYATDNDWLIPHFEKMLYDNALFIQVLCDAYRISGAESYRRVIEETITFCLRELSPGQSGQGFFAALDADSDGEEGKFYTWNYEEILQIVPDMHPALLEYWDITPEGNWEGVTILHNDKPLSIILKKYGLTPEQWQALFDDGRQKLMAAREVRNRPLLDHKMLLSWNALMASALVKAGAALNEQRYTTIADTQLNWLLNTFYKEGKLYRSYDGQQVKFTASLEDHAYLIKALLDYGSVVAGSRYIDIARELYALTVQHFSDEQGLFFYFSHEAQTDIIVRKIETYDGAMPSVNAVMAENAIRIARWYEDAGIENRGKRMLQSMQAKAVRYPTSFAYWAMVLQRYNSLNTLLIAGNEIEESLETLHRHFIPHVLLMPVTSGNQLPVSEGKQLSDKQQLYLCDHFACFPPETELGNILSKIKVNKMLE